MLRKLAKTNHGLCGTPAKWSVNCELNCAALPSKGTKRTAKPWTTTATWEIVPATDWLRKWSGMEKLSLHVNCFFYRMMIVWCRSLVTYGFICSIAKQEVKCFPPANGYKWISNSIFNKKQAAWCMSEFNPSFALGSVQWIKCER